MQVGGTRAGGQQVEFDVINIGIPRTVNVATDGHKIAVASVIVQVDLIIGPSSAFHTDGVHGDEAVDVIRVGHHTHRKQGMVAGAAGFGPERELQLVS